MKKRAFLYLWVIVPLLFCCCSPEPQDISYIAQTSDVLSTYDSESFIDIEENTSTNESDFITDTNSSFRVKAKKYEYKYSNSDIVLLQVTNQTTIDYKATFSITYYDKDGVALKIDSQTYQDIASGHTTYVLFHPGIKFDSYTYNLSVEKISGPIYLSNIKAGVWDADTTIYSVWNSPVNELQLKGDDTFYNILYTKFQYMNANDIPLYVRVYVISFDSNGEINRIHIHGDKLIKAGSVTTRDTMLHYQVEEFTIDRNTWPEHLQGEIRLIVIPTRAVTEEEKQKEIALEMGG